MNAYTIEANSSSLPRPTPPNRTGTIAQSAEYNNLTAESHGVPAGAPAWNFGDSDIHAGVINVLIVGDREHDIVSRIIELEQKGYMPLYQLVRTPEDFLAAVNSRAWDVVISEDVLSQFSGPEALKLLRNRGVDIPFIMVSGIFVGQNAVAMMKAGANDYLVRGNLSQLALVIDRELKVAHYRRCYKRAVGTIQNITSATRNLLDVVVRAEGKFSNSRTSERPGLNLGNEFGDSATTATARTDHGTVAVNHTQFPTLKEMEKQHIFAALELHQGNQTAASKTLAISARKLRYKLKKYKGPTAKPGSQV